VAPKKAAIISPGPLLGREFGVVGGVLGAGEVALLPLLGFGVVVLLPLLGGGEGFGDLFVGLGVAGFGDVVTPWLVP
jgi:hypothetical protein